ncbi:helix-turn-helix transcriptional regulator [Telmatospirillum sp. J64-1]|uniref:helix-turn-helix domain-containing protein n=1 Tax=Telmatospirillum sp. J64-1 TaxID=2502183 RepID=UPI0021043B90|nr:helix-turn-helix transcriptional regulator [Telmatospirillum sp. J64-1]
MAGLNMNTPWKSDLLVLQARIHKARKVQKITQAQAGAIIGMTERSYRDFENGHKDLSAEKLFQLAAALGIRVFDPTPEKKNRKKSSGFKEVA